MKLLIAVLLTVAVGWTYYTLVLIDGMAPPAVHP